MSSTEPPASNPHDPATSSSTPPPPPPPPAAGTPPPPDTTGATAPAGYGVGPVTPGVSRPGELLDRFLARLIDGVLIGIVYFILSLVLGSLLIREATLNEDFTVDAGSTVLYYIVLGIVMTLLVLGYFAFLESSRGQTVGKMLMKLKVVGPDGNRNPTMAEAVKRNIWNAWPILLVIPVLGWILGPILVLVAEIMIAVNINNDTQRRQGWHDKFAGGTQVLKVG